MYYLICMYKHLMYALSFCVDMWYVYVVLSTCAMCIFVYLHVCIYKCLKLLWGFIYISLFVYVFRIVYL